jgi:hypothetical protein
MIHIKLPINVVIPAQAGIQLIKIPRESGTTSQLCPLRGVLILAGWPYLETRRKRLVFRPAPE